MKNCPASRYLRFLDIIVILLVFLFAGLAGPATASSFLSERNPSFPASQDTVRANPFQQKILITESSYLNRTLPNGVKLMIQEIPDSGVVGAEIIIKAGAIEEIETLPGVISLIQQLILKGETGPEGMSLSMLAEEDGSILEVTAEPDMARITLLSPRESFNKNFRRLVNNIKKPPFSDDALKKERERLIEAITSNQSAFQIIREIFLKHFYRYHPYRQPVYGTKSTAERISMEMLEEFHRKYYVGNRISVAIVGDVQGRKMMDFAREQLEEIPARHQRMVDIPWEPVGQEKRLYLMTSSNNAWVFVGFPAPSVKSPDYPAMLILSTVLGEGLSSRLFIELREKEGLAYTLSSHYPQLEGPSHLILFVVTDQRNLGRSRRKLFGEINKIKKDGITGEELEAARMKILSRHLLGRQTAQQVASRMAFYSSLGLGKSYDDTIMRRVEGVTADQVRNVARKYLQNYTVLLIESVPPDRFNEDD